MNCYTYTSGGGLVKTELQILQGMAKEACDRFEVRAKQLSRVLTGRMIGWVCGVPNLCC